MTNKDLLLAFFEAENRRDWETYRQFLSPDIVWTLHSGQIKAIRGIDDYLAAMTAAYEGSESTFVCEALYQSDGGNRIVAILKNTLEERSCDIFDFSDSLIAREYEFILTDKPNFGGGDGIEQI